MTKDELLHFLEPFTDELKLVNALGEDIYATYIMNTDGEGMAALASLEDSRKAARVPRNV